MFKRLTKYNQSNYLIISLVLLNLYILTGPFEEFFRINTIYKYIFSLTAFILEEQQLYLQYLLHLEGLMMLICIFKQPLIYIPML